jgi:hypothetical protein
MPGSVAVLPYAILRRVSSPSGSRTVPPQPLLRDAPGIRPPRASTCVHLRQGVSVGRDAGQGQRACSRDADAKSALNFLSAKKCV